MQLIRRRTILVLGALAGSPALGGCLTGNEGPSETWTPQPGEEVRDALPEYEHDPDDSDEYATRAKEISEALYDALEAHDWFIEVARTDADDGQGNEWIVVVRVHDGNSAEEYVPSEWGGIDIEIEEGDSPRPESP